MAKGVDIEMAPLDEEHVRAKITWSEQDVGGGKLVVEVTVKNMKTRPKTDDQLKSDAMALAVRFARAFADTLRISAARPWCTRGGGASSLSSTRRAPILRLDSFNVSASERAAVSTFIDGT